VTFEDKRRENFEKGFVELERRRAQLLEQQKHEAEERLAFEKREEEKHEKARFSRQFSHLSCTICYLNDI